LGWASCCWVQSPPVCCLGWVGLGCLGSANCCLGCLGSSVYWAGWAGFVCLGCCLLACCLLRLGCLGSVRHCPFRLGSAVCLPVWVLGLAGCCCLLSGLRSPCLGYLLLSAVPFGFSLMGSGLLFVAFSSVASVALLRLLKANCLLSPSVCLLFAPPALAHHGLSLLFVCLLPAVLPPPTTACLHCLGCLGLLACLLFQCLLLGLLPVWALLSGFAHLSAWLIKANVWHCSVAVVRLGCHYLSGLPGLPPVCCFHCSCSALSAPPVWFNCPVHHTVLVVGLSVCLSVCLSLVGCLSIIVQFWLIGYCLVCCHYWLFFSLLVHYCLCCHYYCLAFLSIGYYHYWVIIRLLSSVHCPLSSTTTVCPSVRASLLSGLGHNNWVCQLACHIQ